MRIGNGLPRESRVLRKEAVVAEGRNIGSRTKSTDTSPKVREAQENARGKVSLGAVKAGHSSTGSARNQSILGETRSALFCSTITDADDAVDAGV